MATFQSDRIAHPARYQEKGVFVDVASYELAADADGTFVQMVNVHPGVTVLEVVLYNDALGASTTLDVGFGEGADEDYFIAALDSSTAKVTRNTAAAGFPKRFTEADTIDVNLEGAAGTGTITLVVYMTAEQLDLT